MRRNLLAALAPVLLGAAIFAAAPTLAPSAFAQDANQPPAAPSADDAKQRSLHNLKQLALATHNFADAEFRKSGITPFPARYSVDENGVPLHSWRVFLLPFIEQNELYRQIRLDEPWDSEWNRQFHSQTPELFRRPGSSDPGCVYVCVADESAVLQPTKEPGSQLGLAFPATTDGVSNTILFVERKEPVCWMDPNADSTLDEFLADAAPAGLPVVLADGRAALLPNSFDPKLLKAYVTRAGGEVVPQPSAFAQDAKESPAAPSADDAKQARSVRNLKQLALAAQNFYDRHMSLPARYSVDANGVPLHSWRVFLLPFIEQNELYKQIRLDEPWDSEWNSQFHSKAPELFRRPGSSDPGCVYSCVVDQTAALQPAKEPGSQLGFRLGAFIDGTMNTVLFVERKESVCWMDPNADLTLDEFLATVADAPDAVPAVFLDGRAALLPKSSEPSVLKAYVTRAGGEIVPVAPSADAQDPKLAVQRKRSENNLKQLVLATHNFLDLNGGAFPARCTVDANGKPLHSWRVLLLPFIDEGELYKQIRLDEPWDSEWNSQFHSKTPALFRRPGSSDPGCVYSCVVDKSAALQPATKPGVKTGVRIASFTDGVSNTVLFVERTKPVCWMDPEADLTLDEFLATVAEGSVYRDATVVGMCDGRAQILSPAAKPKVLKGYVTRSGDIDLLPYVDLLP